LSSYIAGNWETEGATLGERMRGIYDTVQKLKLRGLSEDIGKVLYEAALDHWCKVKDNEGEWVRIDPSVVHTV